MAPCLIFFCLLACFLPFFLPSLLCSFGSLLPLSVSGSSRDERLCEFSSRFSPDGLLFQASVTQATDNRSKDSLFRMLDVGYTNWLRGGHHPMTTKPQHTKTQPSLESVTFNAGLLRTGTPLPPGHAANRQAPKRKLTRNNRN